MTAARRGKKRRREKREPLMRTHEKQAQVALNRGEDKQKK
jgi:hypothetical protein